MTLGFNSARQGNLVTAKEAGLPIREVQPEAGKLIRLMNRKVASLPPEYIFKLHALVTFWRKK